MPLHTPCSLLGCFNEIPPCSAPPPPPPMLLNTAAPCTPAGYRAASFADMPREVLTEVVACLEPSDARRLACCCRHLRAVMRPEHCSRAPGLDRLLLHDHQVPGCHAHGMRCYAVPQIDFCHTILLSDRIMSSTCCLSYNRVPHDQQMV